MAQSGSEPVNAWDISRDVSGHNITLISQRLATAAQMFEPLEADKNIEVRYPVPFLDANPEVKARPTMLQVVSAREARLALPGFRTIGDAAVRDAVLDADPTLAEPLNVLITAYNIDPTFETNRREKYLVLVPDIASVNELQRQRFRVIKAYEKIAGIDGVWDTQRPIDFTAVWFPKRCPRSTAKAIADQALKPVLPCYVRLDSAIAER